MEGVLAVWWPSWGLILLSQRDDEDPSIVYTDAVTSLKSTAVGSESRRGRSHFLHEYALPERGGRKWHLGFTLSFRLSCGLLPASFFSLNGSSPHG
jgi:hypothetical protein